MFCSVIFFFVIRDILEIASILGKFYGNNCETEREKNLKSMWGEKIEITTQSDKRSVPFPWLFCLWLSFCTN